MIATTIDQLKAAERQIEVLRQLVAAMPPDLADAVSREVRDVFTPRYPGRTCGPLTMERRVRVLLLLAEHPDGLRAGEISSRLGFPNNGIGKISQCAWFRKQGGSHSHASWVLTDEGLAEAARRNSKKGGVG